MLSEMSLLIRCRALPVKDLFRELGRYGFLNNVNAGENGDFRDSWYAAADALTELDKSERDIVKNVGFSLGNSDSSGQLSMLEANSKLLEIAAEEVREQYNKKGKLYRSIGVLGGLFAAILIL